MGAKNGNAPRKKRGRRADPSPAAAEPAGRIQYGVKPLTPPQLSDRVKVESERQLLAMAKQLKPRLQQDPDFSVLLLANPVLALQHYGFDLSSDLQHHVLQQLRHPPKLRDRRELLEQRLTEALGEPPQPNDPAWMAQLVFDRQGLAAKQIGKREPIYRPPLNADMIAQAQARRPQGRSRYPQERRIRVTQRMGVARPEPTLRRMDLEAPVPSLKPAARAPAKLSLEQAWFYKDDDPLVRDAVELGQIRRRGFPFRTPDEFRKIMAGEKVDGFRKFVTRISLESVRSS